MKDGFSFRQSKNREHTPPACDSWRPARTFVVTRSPAEDGQIMDGTIFRRDAEKHTPEACSPHFHFAVRVYSSDSD